MPKMFVEKSAHVNAPIQKVYDTISDFHHWEAWSPWLITDPNAKVDVRADGKYYEWSGPRTGDGNMTILNESAPNRVDYDLTFLKPWKSVAKVAFILAEDDGKTKVTWNLDSSLPFFLFWMKKSMTAFVGNDYQRGLNMLKEYVEDGSVKSRLNFKGSDQFAGCQYVGIKRDVSIPDMSQEMSADFERIGTYAKELGDQAAGAPFSIYHKWDMVKQQATYTAALPVKSLPSSLPDGMSTGAIPATKVYTVQHVGAYHHLGNAWSTLYMMQRGKEFKAVKGIHPFETYENMPGEVPEEELITNINFAVK